MDEVAIAVHTTHTFKSDPDPITSKCNTPGSTPGDNVQQKCTTER